MQTSVWEVTARRIQTDENNFQMQTGKFQGKNGAWNEREKGVQVQLLGWDKGQEARYNPRSSQYVKRIKTTENRRIETTHIKKD